MAFSDNLQFLRTHRGQTQEQLAELLDVSRQSVSKWESAQSYPEMDTILRICDLYQVNLDTLMRGSVEDSLVEETEGGKKIFFNYNPKALADSLSELGELKSFESTIWLNGEGYCFRLDQKAVFENNGEQVSDYSLFIDNMNAVTEITKPKE